MSCACLQGDHGGDNNDGSGGGDGGGGGGNGRGERARRISAVAMHPTILSATYSRITNSHNSLHAS